MLFKNIKLFKQRKIEKEALESKILYLQEKLVDKTIKDKELKEQERKKKIELKCSYCSKKYSINTKRSLVGL